MKIAIIHSPPHGEVPFRNIGLIYLQTVLIESGYDVRFIDISYEEDRNKTDFYEDMINYLSQRVGRVGDMPDLYLLLSVVFPEEVNLENKLSSIILSKVDKYYNQIKDIADVYLFSNNVLTMYFSSSLAIRLKKYGKITIGGGPATHFPPFTRFALLSGIYDYIISGEGEEIILKLISNINDKRHLKAEGLYYVNRGEVQGRGKVYNSKINIPKYLNFRNIVINDFIPALAGRGCPHRCRFCSESNYWEKFRIRDYRDVIDEMKYQYKKYNIDSFHFHDDSINGNLKWFDNFLLALIEAGGRFKWESFCTPFGLNEKRIEKMRSSGCVLLKMGVQSFSDRVLKLMGRPAYTKQTIETIKQCVRYGISMHFDLLTSFPGETEEDHKINLRILEELFSFSDKIYFSPNPFYLSIGSETANNFNRYNIRIKYYSINETPLSNIPVKLKEIIQKSGRFPESFHYSISEQQVKRRLEDYHKLLIRYNKDYLFLGRNS